jgi:predicted DNA-binding antitoxin AbrB/MazE fold protein
MRVSDTIGVGGIAMREQIQVVYENGVLRPLVTLSGKFQEHQHLTVIVEDADESNCWLADADPTVSLEAVRRALGKAPATIAQLIHAGREER